MTDAIGIRIDEEMLKRVDLLSVEEESDRSTILRKLISTGYREVMKERWATAYIQGKTTISDAAQRAGLTLWDMERYLVERGFRSSYSVEDLMEETAALAIKKNNPKKRI